MPLRDPEFKVIRSQFNTGLFFLHFLLSMNSLALGLTVTQRVNGEKESHQEMHELGDEDVRTLN